MSRQPVWPDAEIESSPNFSLAAQKVSKVNCTYDPTILNYH